MRVSHLRIHGFKTFSRRTEIDFVPGMTAIVGPNGSGKSNIVDAVRWVLGETRARELRGSRMDEVIFSGGKGRPGMGFASVEIEFEGGETAARGKEDLLISRRVVRGEPSYYRINGRAARLRDMDQLLESTGLRQSGYAVVAQNDVDSIIHASPLQRRALVEEAAGVRGLRAQRDAAARRLDMGDQEVERLAGWLGEVAPKIAELEVQAAAALEQREIASRLAELRGSLAREQWRSCMGELRRARQRLQRASEQLTRVEEQKLQCESRRQAATEQIAQCQAVIEGMRLQVEEASVTVASRQGDAVRVMEQVSALVAQTAIVADELSAMEHGVLQREEALVRIAAEQAELDERIRSGEVAHREQSDASTQARTLASHAGGELARARQRMQEVEMELAEARVRQTTQEAAIAERKQRIGDLLEEEARSAADLQTKRVAGEELEARASASWARVEELRSAADAAGQEMQELIVRAGDLEARWASAQQTLAEQQAVVYSLAGRLGALDQDMDEGRRSQFQESGVTSRLFQLITVLPGVPIQVIEAVMEQWAQAWVLEQPEQAACLPPSATLRERFVFLKSDNGMGAAREPLLAGPGSGSNAVEDSLPGLCLRNFVSGGEALDELLDLMFGTSFLVATPDEAGLVVAGGGTAVLPDGEVWSSVGITRGPLQESALSLRASLAHEEELLARATEHASRLGSTVAELSAAMGACREEMRRLDLATRDAAAEARADREAADTAVRAIRELEESIARCGRVRSDLETSEQTVLLELEAARLAARACGELHESAAAELLEVETRAAAQTEQARSLEQTAHALLEDLARWKTARAELARRMEAELEAQSRSDARREQLLVRLCSLELEACGALLRSDIVKDAVRGADEQLGRAREMAREAEAPLAALQEALEAVDADYRELAVVVARAGDEKQSCEELVAVLSARAQELADTSQAADVEEEFDPATLSRVEREISQLERKIDGLGPVNALAPEQLSLERERCASSQNRFEDLSTAISYLRSLAAQLDEAMEQRFDMVFGQVSQNFSELFSELFPGGTAHLELEGAAALSVVAGGDEAGVPGSQGVLLRGVEVVVQPAGKREHPLVQLSGGERTLTALALVFALQRVTPSPFYLFDEVDAALDEANVGRLARLLGRLAKEQQLIVVTHNQLTMAVADALYGISMDSSGTSNIVSMRLTGSGYKPAVAS